MRQTTLVAVSMLLLASSVVSIELTLTQAQETQKRSRRSGKISQRDRRSDNQENNSEMWKQKVFDLSSQVQELLAKLTASNSIIADYKARIEALNKDNDALRQENRNLKIAQASANTNTNTNANTNTGIVVNNDKVLEQINELKITVDQLSTENTRLRKFAEESLKNLNAAEAKIRNLNSFVTRLTEQVKYYESRQNDDADKDRQLNAYQKQIGELNEKYQTIINQQAATVENLKKAQEKTQKDDNSSVNLQDKINALVLENSRLKIDVVEATTRANNFESLIAQFKAQIVTLSTNIAQLQNKAENNNKEANKRDDANDRAVQSLEAELKAANAKIIELNDKLKAITTTTTGGVQVNNAQLIAQLKQIIASLKAKYDALYKKFNFLVAHQAAEAKHNQGNNNEEWLNSILEKQNQAARAQTSHTIIVGDTLDN